jgi:hypothetical protein
MKPPLFFVTGLVLVTLLHITKAAPPASARTITDLNVISARAFQRSISPKFYKSLLVSPVEGWVAVRGNLNGTRLSDLKVVHSELNGRFDQLALELAKDVHIAGYYSIERPFFGEIEGPESLQGKGWGVRQGFKNKMEAIFKLEAKRLQMDG